MKLVRSHLSLVLCPLLIGVGCHWQLAASAGVPRQNTGGQAASGTQAAMGIAAENQKPSAYVNDFEKAEVGKVPEEMMVLSGEFAVQKEGGNQFLELPGSPLDTFGVLVGSEVNGPATCGARIRSLQTGRRFPEFGVGLGGASGYRLWLMPAVGELQLLKGDEVKASVPYKWTSGTWTVFRLQIRQLPDGKWRLEGKAWEHGKVEPAAWMIGMDENEKPLTGRASIWGIPYSEKPIAFDDVMVEVSK